MTRVNPLKMNLIKLIADFIKLVLKPLKKNMLFFIFMYLLGVVTIFIEVVVLGYKIPLFNFLSLLLDIYLMCLLIMIVPKKFVAFFVTILSLSAYLLSIINAFCVEHFYAKIGLEILNVLLETNFRESSEFIEKYVSIDVLWSGTGLIFVLMLFHFLCARFLSLRKCRFPQMLSKVADVLLFVFLIVSFYFCLNSRIDVVRLMMASKVEDVDELVSNHSQNTPLNNLLFSIKMRYMANKGLSVLADSQDKVKVLGCQYYSDNIILVIGESYIKCHSQLYGYDKPTTPLQMERIGLSNKGCIVPFTDVISPSNLTSIVFKNVFSLHSIEETSDWTDAPLFPVLFRNAGYKVFFMTNQFVQALNTDIFNLSGGLFLNYNKLSNAQFDHRNTSTHRYDIGLLEDFDSLKHYKGDHNLFIFHLAGQHIDFYKRSPDVYKKFSISDYHDRLDLNESEKQIVADYDNATYYNDIVVDSIIRRFEDDNAILIYMPDHGEECFDELHRMGRLPVDNYIPEVLRQEYSIPFWIWCSKSYVDTHNDFFKRICDSRTKPFMTDDLPHLMLYLAGISCDSYDETRNILSPNFNTKRKRLVNGKCDYDKVLQ